VGELGYKWARIATFFEGRSDVSVKNRWSALKTQKRKHTEPDERERNTPVLGTEPEDTPAQSKLKPCWVIDALWQTGGRFSEMWGTDLTVEPGLDDRFRNFGGKIW
jgi:hypothetical protein